MLRPLPTKKKLEDLQDEDVKRLSMHFDDSQAVWAREDIASGEGLGKGISDANLKETKRITSAFWYTPDSYHEGARLMKDITEAEANSDATGSTYYGALAGHGLVAQQQMLTFTHGLSEEYLDPSRPFAGTTTEIALLHGLFIDIWIILVHVEVIIAIILWIRWILFVLASPTLIITSSKLANLLL